MVVAQQPHHAPHEQPADQADQREDEEDLEQGETAVPTPGQRGDRVTVKVRVKTGFHVRG
jgi:hypothetical protein